MCGESRTSERRICAVDRQRQALQLRAAGLSYRAIADQLGYAGPSGAFKAVISALDDTVREPAREVRVLELERLDRLLAGVWEKATAGDIQAVAAALRVMERRARLLGLDAPDKSVALEVELEQFLSALPVDFQEAIRARILAELRS